jgi:hypothetical protein
VSRGGWKDAYDAQMGTWRWVRSQDGIEWVRDHWHVAVEGITNPHTRSLLSSLYAVEEDKLVMADPYYISREMTEVVVAASETFSPEPLLDTDLLTGLGFCYFETPVAMPDKYETMIALAGFSWAPIGATTDSDLEQFEAHLNDDRELEPGSVAVTYGEAGVRQIGVALTLYAVPKLEKWRDEWGKPPPVLPIHYTPWYFGMEFEGNEIDEEGARTGVERWWQVIQTTLRLMQQRIGHRQAWRPDRPQRREGQRYGFPGREVVVVRLRRESSDHMRQEPESEANYSHRFIVSGHWRNQWYASGQVHRQIWISPYVKGPEDQPLVVRPRRVFSLVR